MRPDHDTYFMGLVDLVKTRTTCIRRAVGCVLVNGHNHILATGYNGVAMGQPHCNQHDSFDLPEFPNACAGAHAASGVDLHKCEAIHAEQNALLQCKDVFEIETAYVSCSPCITCMKLLLNTSCKRIVCNEFYDADAITLWRNAGREIIVHGIELETQR